MPELPELEIIRDRLRLALAGRRITGVEVRRPEALRTIEPPLSSLADRRIGAVSRYGRLLAVKLPAELPTEVNLQLGIQLASAGSVAFEPTAAPFTSRHLAALRLDRDEDLRVILNGDDDRVAIHLFDEPKRIEELAGSGLDPFDALFTLARFRSALGRRDRTLRRFLTDQRAVGGIGGCYADEILHEARLSPLARAAALRPEEAIRLYMAVKKVLHDAVLSLRRLDRFPEPGDRVFLRVHRRAGRPCPACGDTVRRADQAAGPSAGRAAYHYCPTCQAGGRLLG